MKKATRAAATYFFIFGFSPKQHMAAKVDCSGDVYLIVPHGKIRDGETEIFAIKSFKCQLCQWRRAAAMMIAQFVNILFMSKWNLGHE